MRLVVFAPWLWIDLAAGGRDRPHDLASFAALAAYLVPGPEPTHSRRPRLPVLPPQRLARCSPAERDFYLDRSMTFTAAVLLLAVLAVCPGSNCRPGRRAGGAMKGAVWLVLGFAVTIMIPVRSSLHASCSRRLILRSSAWRLASAVWRGIPAPRQRAATAALMVLPLALLPDPLAAARDDKTPGMLSSQVLETIRSAVRSRPPSPGSWSWTTITRG